MAPLKALIFGATGAVARHCAKEALRHDNVSLTLALRDPNKPIPDLPSSLPRVQADLTDPTSLRSAVQASGATSAFIYAQGRHRDKEQMKASIAALADAGVTHIVLLSSWTIYPLSIDDAYAQGDEHAIPAKHAAAEIALREVKERYPDLRYAAVRPLYFATNVLFEDLSRGEVNVLNPAGGWDYISSEDIGTVCGRLLVDGVEGVVPIVGPRILSQSEAWGIIGRVLGKEIRVKDVTEKEFLKGSEEPMMKSLARNRHRSDEEKYPTDLVSEARANMRRYVGSEGMGFEEWATRHKGEFKQ
ncbi:uncharacterized protein AB675_1056 [Cyphellophora attinorum]|uniref:NAD(P)-binding domain-containing protein n=1 Tax=Cyphellophora attinorum TaxID=1664694 RepID=A0A0N0NKR4_9EURO|nr:uncharacterized protein AB675_1056 [Phialophora attinorum]KPI38139.1 hypothetical protein AB675_1056 [Phialophora attinorum]